MASWRTHRPLLVLATRLSVACALPACGTDAKGSDGQGDTSAPGGASPSGGTSQGGGSTVHRSASPNELCETIVTIVCDWSSRCESHLPSEKDTCLPAAREGYEGCPPLADAIERGEIAYDEAAMAELLDEMRAVTCSTPPWHFLDEDAQDPIFVGRVSDGDPCHSHESCLAGLTCDGFTLDAPLGTCRPEDY